MDELYDDMLRKGLVDESSWLQRAIEQKNPRVDLRLADSKLTYPCKPLDFWDFYLMCKYRWN